MRIATALQVLGVVSVSLGAFLFSVVAGFVVAGVGAVLLGLALEDDR